MRLPFFPKKQQIDPSEIARIAAREAIMELTRVVNVTSPMGDPFSNNVPITNPTPTKDRPLYAWDNPWTYYVPQAPTRRPGSIVNTDTLRRLADNYDILRSCIQHLKREVAAVPVEFTSRNGEASAEIDRQIAEATAWFETPGGLGGRGRRRSHFESEFIEDLCVIGATAVYYSPNRAGKPYEAVTIDASTIRPRVDAFGWPGPNDEWWEQWVMGVKVVGFKQDELTYDGIYPVSFSPFFKSPVEWLINVINSALRADEWNRNWLTDGNTPSDLIALPEGWTPEQIKDYTSWWNQMLTGNLKDRVKTKFVPSGSQKVGTATRKDQEFQAFELWLLRRACSIMGVQPASIGFSGEQYKVSQEESTDSTSAFGVGVILDFRKALYDDILVRLGYYDIQSRNVVAKEEGAKERAERNKILVEGGIKKLNEARDDEGLDPDPNGDIIFVSSMMIPLEEAVKSAAEKADETQQVMAKYAPEPGEVQQGYSQEITKDLKLWERKVLGRLKDGREISCGFESSVIPSPLSDYLRAQLPLCRTVGDVKGLFQSLERATLNHEQESLFQRIQARRLAYEQTTSNGG